MSEEFAIIEQIKKLPQRDRLLWLTLTLVYLKSATEVLKNHGTSYTFAQIQSLTIPRAHKLFTIACKDTGLQVSEEDDGLKAAKALWELKKTIANFAHLSEKQIEVLVIELWSTLHKLMGQLFEELTKNSHG